MKRKYFNCSAHSMLDSRILVCLAQRLDVKDSGVSCQALIFDLSSPKNENSAYKKWFQVDYSYAISLTD